MNKNTRWQTGIWTLWMLLNLAGIWFRNEPPVRSYAVLQCFLYSFVHIACVYMVYLLVLKYYDQTQNPWLAMAGILLSFAAYAALSYVVLKYGISRLPYGEGYAGIQLNEPFFADIGVNYATYFFYAFLYWQLDRRFLSETKLRRSETEKLSMENEKLKTEYSFLKSQINPHFLYNTLDYFYGQSLKNDPQTAEGIATLSHMMRYSLAAGDANGKVWLKEEADQIGYYIHLQQLRFGKNLQIRYQRPEELPDLKLIPHVLITLVENAFKYGVVDDPAHPLLINLETKEDQVFFSMTNRISLHKKDAHTGGIGLSNLQKRLENEYAGYYSYTVTQNEETYKTELTLQL